ncbi:hypothetical protein TRFO_36953 [Tritrichomonas foetus]|uniref:Uncharacterized protein n=1 Tax=Tritrichomonas foetus TaxID=1144522 RepID=A0A1J4JH33_9EUKA|nr:hypothetical protein TRFO_36953 [Tritrichomonas foetus]|eukprot:OHS96797.1 hypothetical protein TRFO_36953 [Tritrichomonas foetus]
MIGVVDIVNGSGFAEENPSSLLGAKTNARQHYQFRFSQTLSSKTIYRMKMAPTKKNKTAPEKLVQKTSREFENTHMSTILPPSFHTTAEVHEIRLRAPGLAPSKNSRQSFPSSKYHNSPSNTNRHDSLNTMNFGNDRKLGQTKSSKNLETLSALNDKLSTTSPKQRLLYHSTKAEACKSAQEKKESQENPDNKNDCSDDRKEESKNLKTIDVQEVGPHLKLHQQSERIVYKPVILVTPADPDAPCSADNPNQTA